jgi:hypothetical protein
VLPDMPYDYAALEPAITGKILELHHSKHHAAYVKGANDTLERLAETREAGDFSGLEKTFAFNLSGHVLHTIFWANLSPEGGDRPDGELAAAIDEHFGSGRQLDAPTSRAAQRKCPRWLLPARAFPVPPCRSPTSVATNLGCGGGDGGQQPVPRAGPAPVRANPQLVDLECPDQQLLEDGAEAGPARITLQSLTGRAGERGFR